MDMVRNKKMKKFLHEYKVTRSKSGRNIQASERLMISSHSVASDASVSEEGPSQSAVNVGTIRTEEYKRDLAEFQARRSSGNKESLEPEKTTPVKKKCGRHSLPVSCTDCASDHDTTFNYEKKSAVKYKKNKRTHASPEKAYETIPSIQFLFQNQVFMPGAGYCPVSFTEFQKQRRRSRRLSNRSLEVLTSRHIDFAEDQVDNGNGSPEFYKNNSLPFDVMNFLEGNPDDVDTNAAAGDLKTDTKDDKDDSGDEKLWEVMSELKHLDQWADEQLMAKSPHSRSDDSKSDISAYGLPIASARNLDINEETHQNWSHGKWGVIPVQIKQIKGITIDHVRKKRNVEINILRKCRHPNIILLMGLYPDVNNNVNIICERCVDSLFGVLHVQGRILSAQTSVQYALDIANALVFLQMQGYIHTQLNSTSVMITYHDTAKLADLGPCVKLNKDEIRETVDKNYKLYSPEPQYVNIEDASELKTSDSEPLISANSSETYLKFNAVEKDYECFRNSDLFRWQAPEVFDPNEEGFVYPCSKSDVYSLCLILWESCNASIPWKEQTYEKLREQYSLWQTGLRLPQNGTYPGSLLALLQSGLKIQRNERMNLETLQLTLQNVKQNLDKMGYLIIPARLQNKTSNFSSVGWDTTSPTDSECLSPQNIKHTAVIHAINKCDSSSDSISSDKETPIVSPLYESIKTTYKTFSISKQCVSEELNKSATKYELLPEKGYSSACSTPIAKLRTRIKDSPNMLHKSDSTEYCSIFSPNRTANLALNDDSNKTLNQTPTAKLSRSFTPKSYKPLHIKVPEYNLNSIKPLLKDQIESEKSSYNFDIKNYSLPTTPIARSNTLRRNAWLSGDMDDRERKIKKLESYSKMTNGECNSKESSPECGQKSANASSEINNNSADNSLETSHTYDVVRDSVTGLRRVDPPHDFLTPETDDTRDRAWSFKSSMDRNSLKYKVDEDLLANMSVKPLVAIHERWIYEANRKGGRSLSLPEDNRRHLPAVKPASHCVDTLQKSLPQLYMPKKPGKTFRTTPSPSGKNGGNWDQFCQARETIARGLSFTHGTRHERTRRDSDKQLNTEPRETADQATDTQSIEEFIRDLIRKEFQHLIQEITDDNSALTQRNEELVNKGIANVMESLNNDDCDRTLRKDSIKSFSRVKINGNNKPLLQITFNRSGENSLQVLDNCINVTICDNNASKEKLNQSIDDTLTDEGHCNALKRCQAFNAIQEARSTEDLYIDDDLSTQMQENFGGKVKLIPLHGSLHEILCEKEDDCCLIKVKQENGCDTIYFKCDNSDTESRDAIDGDLPQDTILFKRSISLIEERFQRVIPKDKRHTPVKHLRKKRDKIRPKSEIYIPIRRETRVLSNSSPSLSSLDKDEVEVNIENAMCYESSSDECLKCSDQEDFEQLEKKIEQELILKSVGCSYLAKISEENLSVLPEETLDKN